MNEKSALKSFGFAFEEFLRVFQSFKQAISEVSEKVPEKSVLGKTISSLWIDVWEKKKKAKSRPGRGSGNIQELRGTRKLFLALFYMVSIRKSDRYKINLLIEGVYSKFQFEIWNIVSTTPSIDK